MNRNQTKGRQATLFPTGALPAPGALVMVAVAFAALSLAGCGGGGSAIPIPGQQVNNTQPIVVNAGPAAQLTSYINGLFTTISVCAPGTNSCVSLNVLVDTGSEGLRVLQSDLGGVTLPPITDSSGNPIAECTSFADSYTWGPMATADIHIAGETAGAVPVAVIATGGSGAAFPNAPSSCTGSGLPAADTEAKLGADGILGIGVFRHDCGAGCAPGAASTPPAGDPYYSCSGSGCAQVFLPLQDQAQNPVWLFPQDNNGVMITLPSIPPDGAANVQGTLIFGIGTQSNNSLGSAVVMTTDDLGNLATNYSNTQYDDSSGGGTFFDTGSNAIFFLDDSTSGLPLCATNSAFYCPGSPASFSTTTVGQNNATAPANFTVANGDSLLSNNTSNFAFNDLGGPYSSNGTLGWDFGLPFFFGRTIFIAINTQNTPAGPGPFIAY